MSARGYVLKGRPAATFAPLASPAGWSGVPTSGPERGRLSREDSWGPPEPSLEDLSLLSGPARRLSPLLPPVSLRPATRPWPPAFSGPPLAMAACSAGIPFSWRARAGGGGLSLRRELERVTDMFSNSSSSSVRAPSLAPLLPRTMVWGPGQRQGRGRARRRGTQDVYPTHKDRTTQHTQRQDRDGMKKCHGVMMGRGGSGRTREAPQPLPAPGHVWREGSCRTTSPSVRLSPPQDGGLLHSERHPLPFPCSSGWGAVPGRGGVEGKAAEATPPRNQPLRAANYRRLGRGPSLALLPLQPARAANPKPGSLFPWRLRVG